MNENKRTRLISLAITVGLHLLLVVVLILWGFPSVRQDEESGVLLMVGQMEVASGNTMPAGQPIPQPQATETHVTPPAPTAPAPAREKAPLLSQNQEEAPAIATPKRQETSKKQPEKVSEEEIRRQKEREREIERQKEEERKKRAEEERKKQEATAINRLITGAFGQSGNAPAQNPSHGNDPTGQGAQGNPAGNSDQGQSHGSPGWGSYDLGGRGIEGNLPRPAFDVNASGTVVVAITVNADGKVTAAAIQPKGTTTSDTALRNAAKNAAAKARFKPAKGTNIQYGTITYHFDSDN